MDQVKQKMYGTSNLQLRLTARYLIIEYVDSYEKALWHRATKSVIKKALQNAKSSDDRTARVVYESYDKDSKTWFDPGLGAALLYVPADMPKRKEDWAMSIGCQDFTLQNNRAIKRWAGVK